MSSSRSVFISAFVYSMAVLLLFNFSRGWAWDGDSVVSASQFVKWLNPAIFETPDGGTGPKLLTILLFGSLYQLTGSFHLLTILAILMNSVAFGFLCLRAWKSGFAWYWILVGLSFNTLWMRLIVESDNLAFSIPLVIIGLYLYFSEKRYVLGILLLTISNLFRPGAENILFAIFLFEIYKQVHRKTFRYSQLLPLMISGFICGLHSAFGWRLAYPTYQSFFNQCVSFRGDHFFEQAPHFYHSLTAFTYYAVRVLKYVAREYRLTVFIALLGVYALSFRKNSSCIGEPFRSIYFLPLLSISIPLIVFSTGTPAWDDTAIVEYSILVTCLITVGIAFLKKLPAVQRLLKRSKLLSKENFQISTLAVLVIWSLGISYSKGVDQRSPYILNPYVGARWYTVSELKDLIRAQNLQSKLKILAGVDLVTLVLDLGKNAERISAYAETETTTTLGKPNITYLQDRIGNLSLLKGSRDYSLEDITKYPQLLESFNLIYAHGHQKGLVALAEKKGFKRFNLKKDRIAFIREPLLSN